MKFIDGLCDDIKSVILVQRPVNLDTACALALLQEAAHTSRRRDFCNSDGALVGHSYPKLPAHVTVPRWDKSLGGETSDVKSAIHTGSSFDSMVASLRAYRRARGLCQYYAEKWEKGHKCAQTVQLHAIQEFWDMLAPEVPESEGEIQDSTEQFMMLLSQEAFSEKAATATLRLQGCIQGLPLLILLDSRSSHSFLNAALSSSLHGVSSLHQPLSVRVANGNILHCTSQLYKAVWSVQNIQFQSDLKLLHLPCYDLILGSANCYIWSATFGPFWLSVGDQATRNFGSYITTAVCLCTLSEAEVPVSALLISGPTGSLLS